MNNLWNAFIATVERWPDKVAFYHDLGCTSYGDFYDRVLDFRAEFFRRAVARGDRVLLLVDNEVDVAAAVAACWGQASIPVFISGNAKEAQVDHAIDLVSPALVIAGSRSELKNKLAVSCLKAADVSRGRAQSEMPGANTLSGEPASIVFTSGSTGLPRGVVQSHYNLYQGCQTVASYLGLTPADVLLCPVPWSFDYGYGQLLSTLIAGVGQVIPTLNNPTGICEAIEAFKPTVLAGTPSLFAFLVGGMSPLGQTETGSLRLLMNTGGVLPVAAQTELVDAFHRSNLILNYGLTETYRSCYVPPNLRERYANAIGIAIPGVSVDVFLEDGRLAAPGEYGELVHRGNFVCMGYWNDTRATQSCIRPDPLAPTGVPLPARAMYTGDIGYRDEEGVLYYVGRKDRLIKTMGIRVSPHEVELVLLASRMVEQVVVLGVHHDVMGHAIHAVIVSRNVSEFDLRELKKYARNNLPQHLLPRHYEVVNELPLTANGKPDLVLLERRILENGTAAVADW